MYKKGFTILEVILAIFILTTAAFSSFNLIQQVVVASSLNESRLTAYYLAQEIIEDIKNIRDTNYLQGSDWLDGIEGSDSEKIKFLNTSESKFDRKIAVALKNDGENDYLEVRVIVEWRERTIKHGIEVVSLLYDWY